MSPALIRTPAIDPEKVQRIESVSTVPAISAVARKSCVPVIQPQPSLRRIAVCRHFDDTVSSIDVAPPDQMQRRPTAPIRTVKIIAILASPPIVADETLFVDIRKVALSARVAGKIEHVPYVHSPEISAVAQDVPRR